jgi:hypothetical protein
MSNLQPFAKFGAEASHREKAGHDLLIMLAVLFALSVAGVFLFLLITSTEKSRDPWPFGTPISRIEALTLTHDEQEQLDQALFHSKDEKLLASIGEASLPPLVPVPDEQITAWQIVRASVFARPPVSEKLNEMRRCSSTPDCALKPLDDEKTEEFIKALSVRSDPFADICSGTPLEERQLNHIRIPRAMFAIALSRSEHCRSKAIDWFNRFLEQVRKADFQNSSRAEIFGLLAIAKLRESQREPGSAEFRRDMQVILNLVRADKDLQQAYEEFAELPAWGLSAAEIRAAALLAEARAAFAEYPGARLARQLRGRNLLPTPNQLALLQVDLSPGRTHLRNVWCAIAFRSEAPVGMGAQCLQALAQLPLPPSVRCAIVARRAITGGTWRVSQDDACARDGNEVAQTTTQSVLERVARSGDTWKAALARYQQTDVPASERQILAKYLESYASASWQTRVKWFAHEYPRWSVVVVMVAGLLLACWLGLFWALWRLRSLQRFLPPRLTEDAAIP